MNKQILTGFLLIVLCFALVAAADLTIGAEAIVRDEVLGSGLTVIDLTNPATSSWTITKIQVYANSNLPEGWKVGTFFGSGLTYTSRDYAEMGAVTAGSMVERTIDKDSNSLSIEVQSGDFIGAYWVSGGMELDISGGAGIRYKAGDQFGTGEQTHTQIADYQYSIRGIGAAPPTDSCSCPASGHWQIVNSDNCTLATTCSLVGGDLHLVHGALTITSTGTLSIPSGYKIIIEDEVDVNFTIEDGGQLVLHK